MTNSEVIKMLQDWNKDLSLMDDEKEGIECHEIAISALEKQIPKKPDLTSYDEQGYYKCPSCGGELASLDDYFPKQPYCADCGQAIDWNK